MDGCRCCESFWIVEHGVVVYKVYRIFEEQWEDRHRTQVNEMMQESGEIYLFSRWEKKRSSSDKVRQHSNLKRPSHLDELASLAPHSRAVPPLSGLDTSHGSALYLYMFGTCTCAQACTLAPGRTTCNLQVTRHLRTWNNMRSWCAPRDSSDRRRRQLEP